MAKIHFPEAGGAPYPPVPVTLPCVAQNSQVTQLLALKVPATGISPASPLLLLLTLSGEAELRHRWGRAESSQTFSFQPWEPGTVSWGPED